MVLLDGQLANLVLAVEVVTHLAQMVLKDVMVGVGFAEDHFFGEFEVLGPLSLRSHRLVHLAEADVARLSSLGVRIGHVQMSCVDRARPAENINGWSDY